MAAAAPAAPSHALTKNQQLVLSALQNSAAPLSAYSLLDHLRDDGFRAPLQVYRALEKLIAFGLVHRLESLNSFVACSHRHDHGPGSHPHGHGVIAFAICERCGRVEEFTDEAVEERLTGWAGSNGFKLEKTIIEMRGTCAACLAH
ncbi:Fur family transcriptional regulator [Tianweitania sediminis]|jgi:Fur family zinc uptake transcriptional regulator|uniref:Transcriptional repressor n=1 Tax=Tianweitania sediminis TaxID=1502156 RepID=A0A8J7RKW0_9HYPH|nr:Fur family transcriptional regulator [Tianweitania sediminis]MBP0437574.1 transcriptional repressor [Tianweitania sediminis]HEV7418070.1 Fur family transcriptional regulator [Tianweitania sediminis]